ncbi:dCTP pyrophosphatase 1 isoform X2 [Pteronotus mesoamericanus]|uniref:dCTP pyrophosphatase 1 isoform X1 n=1 Tax=Pteronotus mesoamericanus TaxID=1884717 RepID=UPI0023ED5A48|nr:dCTP pyrophosphatase 1 isoform X1 [Pteronotus parnellii mesoamericanus]XP_054438667.1 dCTP pyrophosphatase 1 isoform X2 [Pteronotus parnellii mesoamericanus]
MSSVGSEQRGDSGGQGTGAAGLFSFSPEPTLEDIRRLHAEFAAERDWDQFHKPRNLLLALVGEVGELAELFQWKPDEEPGPQAWPPKERAALQEELSDVLIYLVALAARCRVDLPQAVLSKMDTNRRRYPPHLSRGSSRKYTDLPHGATSEDQTVGATDLACESSGQASA